MKRIGFVLVKLMLDIIRWLSNVVIIDDIVRMFSEWL